MEDFKPGKILKLLNGDEITVVIKLGEGGQGVVYKVLSKGKEYALKWYLHSFLKSIASQNQSNVDKYYNNLVNNASMGSPSNDFLWPLAITEKQDDSFGYLMDVRPPQYLSFVRLLNAVDRFKSTTAVINSTINMVNAFQALHRKGYSYQDLNDGNFFVNPENGDVLICDNDNVAPYGEGFGIGGKSRYMAPEIVLGKAKPNINTDAFSLSVVLFMFYFLSHPLEGSKVAECPCLTEANEKRLYAVEPVFIYDPDNASNRPVRGIHNNVINLWPLFPTYLRDTFIRAFCQGTKNLDDRLAESEWKKILYRLKDDIIECPKCGEGNFASLEKNNTIECCDCSLKIEKPLFLSCREFDIALYPGKCITERHSEGGDPANVIGMVIQNKNNPNLWGIKNVSDKLWIAHMPNGVEKTINKNDVVPVLKDVSIIFGITRTVIK